MTQPRYLICTKTKQQVCRADTVTLMKFFMERRNVLPNIPIVNVKKSIRMYVEPRPFHRTGTVWTRSRCLNFTPK